MKKLALGLWLLAASMLGQNKISLFNRILATPSAATGDLYYTTNAGGTISRIPIGSPGQFLGISGGIPAWATLTSVSGSGATDAVTYWSSSSAITGDASNLFYDPVKHWLSIGVAPPTGPLTIQDNRAGVVSQMSFTNIGAGDAGMVISAPATNYSSIQVQSDHLWNFQTTPTGYLRVCDLTVSALCSGSGERLKIDTSGNGILGYGGMAIGATSLGTNAILSTVGGAITVGSSAFTANASLHINQIYGGNGRLIQAGGTGNSLDALSIYASTSGGGTQQWWAVGPTTGNVYRVQPNATSFSGTTGLNMNVSGQVGVNAAANASHDLFAPLASANSLDILGAAGAGYITLLSQSANPAAPAAGTLLLHSSTTQGFTRMEQDNEATTNLIYSRDTVFIARNTSGSTINPGQPVYVTGATGNVPNIGLAKADVIATLPAIGVALDPITNNSFGQIMALGVINSIDTSAFSVADRLYVSQTTAGVLTNVRPPYPYLAQRIASVLVSGVGNGSLLITTAPFVGGQETGTTASAFKTTQLTLQGSTSGSASLAVAATGADATKYLWPSAASSGSNTFLSCGNPSAGISTCTFVGGGGSGTVSSISTTAPITGCSSPCTSTATIGVSDFVSAGVSHANGTVPDPGSTLHTPPWLLGEDAAFHNPATAGAPVISSAAEFQPFLETSSSSYMTVPDNTALDATSGVSVSAWVYVKGQPGSSGGIFSKATAAGGTGAATCGDYTMLFSGTEWDFGVNGSGSCSWGAIATFAHGVAASMWHHVVGTYTTTGTTNVKLYIDGAQRATSGTYTTNLNHTGTIGVVGAWFDKSSSLRSCDCIIDDIRIWKDVALTATDVTNLYNKGIGQQPLNAMSANETVAWRFDEGTGTTATDAVSGLVLTTGGVSPIEWVRGIIIR